MSVAHPFAMPAGRLRHVSGLASIAIAASAAAAAFVALPDAIPPGPEAADAVPPVVAWSVPLTADGKFAMRLGSQAEPERTGGPASGPTTPAALAMPLAIAWSAPASETPRAIVSASARPQPRIAHADVAPVRRMTAVARAGAEPAGQPLVIAAVAAAQPDLPRQPGLIGRVVSGPAARAAGLVTDAAGVVGAAGSWTVAQATSLLPRW